MKKNIFYFFPHYDDEIFVIPRIRTDLGNGHSVKVVYFMKSEERKIESEKFFAKIGLANDAFIHLGDQDSVQDSQILSHLPFFFASLKSIIQSLPGEVEIVCTAYEGGHQDHDAVSLLARGLASAFHVKVLEFFCYNGYGTRGRLYRTASPLKGPIGESISYQFRDWRMLLRATRIYRSQRKAMLGLLPFLLLKAPFKALRLRSITGTQLGIQMHLETPLYERWPRTTQKEFISLAHNYDFLNDVMSQIK